LALANSVAAGRHVNIRYQLATEAGALYVLSVMFQIALAALGSGRALRSSGPRPSQEIHIRAQQI